MRIVLMLVFFSLTAGVAKSQDIILKGILTDKTDLTPVVGASVNLTAQKNTELSKTVVTGKDGNFQFSGLAPDSYTITITSIGYEKVAQKIVLQASNKQPIPILIGKLSTELEGVTVTAKAPPVRQKGDTSEFSASQFKVNPDATAEDMIKKLPGVVVDKSGNVTAMGEQVRKVTVDGRDFFGDDATAALKNLPAEVIDKIQVFDKLSDQAQLTGFDDGNSQKTINIVTKSGIKNGQFGRAFAGYGTDERYQLGGNMSFFKGNRRLSVVANFNNINQQNFGSQDLLGITSSGGGGGRGGPGGGGRGQGGGGFGGGQDNFTVGQASGISKTNALGLNFSNQYGKKLTLSGSYFYNNSITNNESLVNLQTFYTPKDIFSTEKSNTVSENTNHRVNLRLEYKIDSSNSIFIIPSISFQKNNSVGFSSLESYYGINDSTYTSDNRNNAERNGFNIRNNILYRHSFAKRGRSLSLGFNTTFNKNDGETITDNRFRFFDNTVVTDSLQNQFFDNSTNGTTIGGNIAYTEPVGKKGQLQMDYNLSVQHNKADQQAFDYDGAKYTRFVSSLSNKFDNTITTNNAGVNYRLGQSRDEQLSFGVNFQNSKLESERIFPTATSVNQTFSNVLPNVMWRKKLSTVSNIRLFYRASVNFPSVTQLQDVVNTNNPLRVSMGNPALKQSYTHFLAGRYMYTNSKTSTSFFANLFLQSAADYISNATYIPTKDSIIQNNILLKKGSQLTKPANLDGYRNVRTFFTYSMPLKFIKTTLNLNVGFSYSKLPGLIKEVKTNTDNMAYNTGVVLASNISEFVDFNVSYNANFNNAVTTTTSGEQTTKYVNQSAGVQLNLLSKNGWFLQNDVSGQSYSGLSGGFNQSFWLWNAGIGKKFLKQQAGELKLSVFDLLKQNQSIVRTVTGAYIEDSQSKVLQQFFMLTFTYKLKNFGTAASNNMDRNNRGQGGMGMGRGGF